MAIKNITLTSAVTAPTVFTAPSNGEVVITPIYICNRSGATITANLYLVDNSGGVGAANEGSIIYKNLQIANGDTYVIDQEKLILSNNGTGDFIAANVGGHANANANVTMTISYSSI